MNEKSEARPLSAATLAEFFGEATADAVEAEGASEMTSRSSLDERRRMAQEIVNFEARRDKQGRLKVYNLPKGDGGGRFEVAGLNERYHREVCLRLVKLIENNQHAQAEALAVEYIAGYTDLVDRWCSDRGIEFFLRDCVFNRGPGGAAWIVQRAVSVTTDMVVGDVTRAAIRLAERDAHQFLDTIVAAREAYERERARRNESSIFWKGLVNRWTKAKAVAISFMTEAGTELTHDIAAEFSTPEEAADDTAVAPYFEDSDDESVDALVEFGSPDDALTLEIAAESADATTLVYANQNAIRNRKCTKNVEDKLVRAVTEVYGLGCRIHIYSGGQDRKGAGKRRTGSIRHDDHGNGGRAADVHVFASDGRQIRGLELARLGQFWLARKFGGVGHEMAGGGIHLDEWTTPPPGGGMFWTYAYSQNLPWGTKARQLLERGAKGQYP